MAVRYRPDRKEQLYICVCRLNPHAPKVSATPEEIHLQHRAWVQNLADKDLLEASGPARDVDGSHLGSIFILRAASSSEAQRLIAEDPQVKQGQRIPEIIPWQRMWFED
jgi:uncharacterized protein YciI